MRLFPKTKAVAEVVYEKDSPISKLFGDNAGGSQGGGGTPGVGDYTYFDYQNALNYTPSGNYEYQVTFGNDIAGGDTPLTVSLAEYADEMDIILNTDLNTLDCDGADGDLCYGINSPVSKFSAVRIDLDNKAEAGSLNPYENEYIAKRYLLQKVANDAVQAHGWN